MLLVVLGGLYFLKKSQVDDERDKLAGGRGEEPPAAEPDQLALRGRAAAGRDRDARPADPDAARHRRRVVLGAAGALAHDPVRRLAHLVPGHRRGRQHGLDDAGAARRPPAPPPIGTANFTAVGTSFDAVAAWIQRIGSDVPDFSDLWVPSAAKSGSSRSSDTAVDQNVTFSSTANLTDAAKSNRADQYKAAP